MTPSLTRVQPLFYIIARSDYSNAPNRGEHSGFAARSSGHRDGFDQVMKLPLIPNSEFAWYLHFLNTARVSSTPFLSKDTSIASLHLGFRGMRRNCVCL